MNSLFQEIFDYINKSHSNFSLNMSIMSLYDTQLRSRLNCLAGILKSNCEAKYVFVGYKYKRIIDVSVEDGNVVVVGGWKLFLLSLISKWSFYSNMGQLASLCMSWNLRSSECIEDAIDLISSQLKMWNAKILVVVNDSFPLERMWIAAARRVGIVSVCVQHGIFSISEPEIHDGKYADIICVYDNWQRKILKNSGARKIYTLGFYDDFKYTSELRCKDRKVCIVGQPWIQFYSNNKDSYVYYVNRIIFTLERSGIEWCYKPHPAEKDVLKYFPNIHKHLSMEPLRRCLCDYDVFISLYSTVLLEATMANKVSIQVKFNDIYNESLSEYGYCYCLDLADIDDCLAYMVNHCPPVKYFGMCSDLSKRWLTFVDSVVK